MDSFVTRSIVAVIHPQAAGNNVLQERRIEVIPFITPSHMQSSARAYLYALIMPLYSIPPSTAPLSICHILPP